MRFIHVLKNVRQQSWLDFSHYVLKTTGEYAHKDLIDYLIHYKEFIDSDLLFMNDLRIKRNNSAYDGKKIDPVYLVNNKNKILELIERLKKIIRKKL